MPDYSISFELRKPNQLDFPIALMERGHYKVAIDELGVTVSGIRDGLRIVGAAMADRRAAQARCPGMKKQFGR